MTQKIKVFFTKNGLILNWIEFEKLDMIQKINTLAMIAPIANEEKQKILAEYAKKMKLEQLSEEQSNTALAETKRGTYKDYITDYSETSPVITTPNSRFTYYATFVKVGNQVTITGNFTSIGIQAYGRTIFTIADLDYECIAERYFAIATDATTLQDRIGVFMTGTTFKLNSVALDGEKFNYTITYTALN